MKYFRDSDGPYLWDVLLPQNAAPTIALSTQPGSLEEECRKGDWLILVASPASGYTNKSIDLLIELGRELDGKVRCAVRAPADVRGTQEWCPELGNLAGASQVWLFYRMGVLQQIMTGFGRDRLMAEIITPLMGKT